MVKKFKIIGIKMNDVSYTYIYIGSAVFYYFYIFFVLLLQNILSSLHCLYFFIPKFIDNIYEYILEVLY